MNSFKPKAKLKIGYTLDLETRKAEFFLSRCIVFLKI